MPPLDTDDSDRRLQKALLAYVRQEFGAPVLEIVGYAEFMLEDATAQGLESFVDDLGRIQQAGRQLQRMVDGLVDGQAGAHGAAEQDYEAFRGKLRHDLRTPINAITGYGEMLLEDAEDGGHEEFAGDLGKLLDAARRLLAQIDTLVEFGREEAAAGTQADEDAPPTPATRPEFLSTVKRAIQARPAHTSELGDLPSHILVVDDTAANRDLLSRRLIREGHQVTVAEDGAVALALVEQGAFDLILLDLMMPGISGYEVLIKLKENARSRHIPVIMISALDEIDSIAHCVEVGAEDYLPKPVNPVLLRARISACLEKKRLRDREQALIRELRTEKERSEALLLNILPRPIVTRIHQGETFFADRYPEVTVLFCDLVGFTEMTARRPAGWLVELLNGIFSRFDQVTLEHGIEKIKTIGDNYMAAAGLPEPSPDHARAIARLALAMRDIVVEAGRAAGEPLRVRIGLHTGPVLAGVIGTHKFIYDIWGDTVNIASRMESHGLANEIQVSAESYRWLKDEFLLERRGTVELKGRGQMETYFLRGAR
jgi:adenylate cyclase